MVYNRSIVGDVSIVGADDNDPTMALARRLLSNSVQGYIGNEPALTKQSAEQAIARAMQEARALGQPIGIDEPGPDRTYTYFLPLSLAANTASGAAATIQINVQKPFRPERYVLKPDTARDFVLTEFRIGVEPSFAANGDIPGEMFLPDAFNARLNARTGQTSQSVSVSVRNIATDARPFYSGLSGSAIR